MDLPSDLIINLLFSFHQSFLYNNHLAYKTYLTQEMLKNGFLASNGVYISTAHNEKIFKRYEKVLDEIFYKIKILLI